MKGDCDMRAANVKKLPFLLLSILLPLISVTPAHADEALTLVQALELARAQNHDLAAARARLDEAHVAIEQSWQPLLPTLAAQGKYTHNYKEVKLDLSGQNQALFGLATIVGMASPAAQQAVNAFEAMVNAQAPTSIVIQKGEQLDGALNATVPLVVPWAYPGVKSANRSFAAARATLAVTESQLLYSAAQAFYGAAGTDEIVSARKHAVEVAQKTRDDAQTRLDAGVVNRVELMRAQVAMDRAVQAAREASDAHDQAYRALATALQIRTPFHLLTERAPMNLDQHSDALVDEALKLRPELASAQLTVSASDAQVSSAEWRYAPTLSAFGQLRGFNYAGFSGDKYAWLVGLQLDWVLYDAGVRDAARHLAQAQAVENRQRLLSLRDSVADNVRNAEQTLSTKRQALQTAERAVELSTETLNLVRVQHDAGTATQLDLLQAQDTLVGSEVARAQARFDLALSDLGLQQSIGAFPNNILGAAK